MFKNNGKALCFDDVLLVPSYSDIISRSEVDLSTSLGTCSLQIPIISSPMDTVTQAPMALEMLKNGGLGILHRYNSVSEQVEMVREMREQLEQTSSSKVNNIAAAIGVSGDYLTRARALFDAGVRVFCVDVAHGHHTLVKAALANLKDAFGESAHIMAGNVATASAFTDLESWGADSIRVGVGGGSICSTRIQTGHGLPTLSSVIRCAAVATTAKIIADGGIKNSGDIVKALAAGADMVMLGSLLAGTDETPGDVLSSSDGNKYKVYRGMASVEAQKAWRGSARSLEGVSTTIPYKGPVSNIISQLSQNIRSGLSYSGCRSIAEFHLSAKFVEQSSSGRVESTTHIMNSK